MSVTAAPPGNQQAGDRVPLADAADRGSLTVADRVVERVASHTATMVPHAAAAPRRVLGVSVGSARPQGRADVSAEVYGDTAAVAATIAVAWPHPVAQVADELRRRIREEVQRVSGVRVDQVDVEVVSLDIPVQAPPRVR